MIILYDSEERARDFELLEPAFDHDETRNLLLHTRELLSKRGEFEAANFLDQLDFRLSRGTNPFRDEFYVLHAPVSIEMYEYFRRATEEAPDYEATQQITRPFRLIASTVTDLDIYVRFVICQLDLSKPPAMTKQISNQALFTFQDSSEITYQGLNFRSKTEIKLFEALIRRGLLVLPLPIAVMGEMRNHKEPDFVVFCDGKAGILEIHGDSWHTPETAADEHERRRAFKKLGVSVYEIFGADRCWKDPDGVVADFLQELTR